MKKDLWDTEQLRRKFIDEVMDFTVAPWQEDIEIEFASLIAERSVMIRGSSELAVRSYLKRMAEANKIWGNQMFTDAFLSRFEGLICLK